MSVLRCPSIDEGNKQARDLLAGRQASRYRASAGDDTERALAMAQSDGAVAGECADAERALAMP